MYTCNGIEENILNILFNHKEKQGFIVENLKKEFFTDAINGMIFEEAQKLYLKGEEIDSIIICENLKKEAVYTRITEILINNFAVSAQISKYCKILFNNHVQKLIQSAKSNEDFEYINELKNHYLFEEDKILHISAECEEFDKNYEKLQKTTVFTYYQPLDDCIGSFMGGDYIALGGSTGIGKTAIALNFSRQVCMQDRTVLYFSLEMPLKQLQNRFVCMNENISATKYRSFGLNLVEMQKYKQGLLNLKQWNLNVVCDFDLTPEKMRIYIQEQSKKRLDFVVLDYLGLMAGYNNKSSYEKTTIISRKIKLMAGEFNVPILVLVQLNRDLKNRQDKRPVLSDIRESGAIEQDADFVIFAHREGLYDKKIPPNVLDLIIAKNRHGASNKTIKLDFNLETQNIKEFK